MSAAADRRPQQLCCQVKVQVLQMANGDTMYMEIRMYMVNAFKVSDVHVVQ
jgi:hypothetical protein